MTALRADLHRLPDVQLVQGTFGDWRGRYFPRKKDKDDWVLHLLQAGAKSSTTAILNEPVNLRVKVYYATATMPDIDNLLSGLKPLLDLLEPLHMVKQSTRGYVGWVANDRLIASLSVERFTDPSRAPLTQLRMEAV